jgi:hypothetical protein
VGGLFVAAKGVGEGQMSWQPNDHYRETLREAQIEADLKLFEQSLQQWWTQQDQDDEWIKSQLEED